MVLKPSAHLHHLHHPHHHSDVSSNLLTLTDMTLISVSCSGFLGFWVSAVGAATLVRERLFLWAGLRRAVRSCQL